MSLMGWLFGSNTSKTNSTQTQTSSPTYGGEFSPLLSMLMKTYTDRLKNPSALPPGYEAGGIRSINQTYDPIAKSLANTLTARGLGTSPVAGAAETNLGLARGGDIASFETSLPLINQQLQLQDLLNATNFLNYGRGMTATGTGTSSTEQTSFPGLANLLAFGFGAGLFGGVGGGMPGTPIGIPGLG